MRFSLSVLIDWMAVIAFVLSTYTFIYQLVAHRKNLKLEVYHIYSWGDDTAVYVARLALVNKSSLPIAVTGMSVKWNGIHGKFESASQTILNHKTTVKGIATNTREVCSTPFPVSLQGLESKSGIFFFLSENSTSLSVGEKLEFQIHTNRGIVRCKTSFNGLSDRSLL